MHHDSHAASAFFPSPFEEAAILTLDGVGEWATATLRCRPRQPYPAHARAAFPHSLGLLYSAFTYYCGFKVNSGEYKLMGLAPYGQPRYVDRIVGTMVDVKDDGSIWMDMSYFNYCQGLTMTSQKFDASSAARRAGPKARSPNARWTSPRRFRRSPKTSCSRLRGTCTRKPGCSNLCLAGGVALNCVANGRILREGPFENIWIQPAAGDAGGALGAALLCLASAARQRRAGRSRVTACTGRCSGRPSPPASSRRFSTAEGCALHGVSRRRPACATRSRI